ncbi:MAG: prolyl oligopeptidase family serine peptidase [Candidatus Omnitrophica bacterium]|nr:prolyl oligopeptidase family serine peptidase [Candidatus Omnitrophota bacterium]
MHTKNVWAHSHLIVCFIILHVLACDVSAYSSESDILQEIETLKGKTAENEDLNDTKARLLQLLDVAREEDVNLNEEIFAAIDETHKKIMEQRPQQQIDRLTLYRFLKEYSQSMTPAYSFARLDSRHACQRNAKALRKKIIDLLGGFPKRNPLNAVILETKDFDEYVMEKIMFDPEPGRSVVGYLLMPKNKKTPLPTVVCLHEHGGEYFKGKDGPVGNVLPESGLTYARDLAQRGYITLTIDAPCFGERIEDEGQVDYLASLIGRPLFGLIVYDDIRSVDYLLTRSEVDKKRIGCIGHSMGGIRAIFLSGLDERISCGVSLNGFSNMKDVVRHELFYWPPTTYLKGLLPFAEIEDVVSLSAPRPFLVAVGQLDDSLPVDDAGPAVEHMRKVYSFYHREKSFQYLLFKNEGHGFPSLYHNKVYSWIDRWI